MSAPCPAWFREAVFYQVYPQSFSDSDGDGIGDIPGIIAKLDYIQYLGFNAIWINPCFVSPFQDAGYDVADYYTVAPRYGTNKDLERLFAEARERGIRVCLDLVAGHTSVEHPWFKESCRARPNKYTNWYIWTDTPWRLSDGYSNLIRGYAERPGCYLPNYFWFQPALNYGFARPATSWQLPTDHPDVQAVRAEMASIMRFWLDRGAAGFRVDMAMSLVKEDPGWEATTACWHAVRRMLDAEYPEAVLVSEWSSPTHAIAAGFHADFLLYHAGLHGSFLHCDHEDILAGASVRRPNYFRREGRGDMRAFLDEYLAHYREVRGRGYISLISGNHDFIRLALDRSPDELAVVFAWLLTMPGVPFVYYGDEIGMGYRRGLVSKEGGYERTGSRTPMQWSAERNAGFSTAPMDALYLPVDARPGAPNVAAQRGCDGALLETVRTLIALRKAHPALGTDGEFAPRYAETSRYPFVYERWSGDEHLVIALNPAAWPVAVELAAEPGTRCDALLTQGAKLTPRGDTLHLEMAGVSYGIFALRRSG